MKLKAGELSGTSKSGNPVLKTPSGEAYEVSFVASYVWEHLDGKQTEKNISENIASLAEVEESVVHKKVHHIIDELEKRGLVVTLSAPTQNI